MVAWVKRIGPPRRHGAPRSPEYGDARGSCPADRPLPLWPDRRPAQGRAAAKGSVSGRTRTSVVSLSGGVSPPPRYTSSTKNAVQPAAGVGTLATYPPSGCRSRALLCQTGPSVSRRKSRACGLVACHNLASLGTHVPLLRTRIEPSDANLQVKSGRGAPLTIDR